MIKNKPIQWIPMSKEQIDKITLGKTLEQTIQDWNKKYFNRITCECVDPRCKKVGMASEVENHIEDCSCSECHNYYGKL